MSFATLGLENPLLLALADLGHTHPTSVQEQVIPAILGGRDVWAQAPTGSGKTGAFLLPLLQSLSRETHSPRAVRSLILTPTRELASQIEEVAQNYGRHLEPRLKVCVGVGGVSINPQMMALRGGADVLVATPGRLLDLLEQNALVLTELRVLVFDEADRMFSLGFSDELNQLLGRIPNECQKLLFSATFPPSVRGFAHYLLHEPLRVTIESEASESANVIYQRAILVDTKKRTKLLLHLLSNQGWNSVLVFASTREGVQKLTAELLHAGVRAAPLHGDLSQDKRSEALADFKAGHLQVLVATDLAARGLDVLQLAAVVNYDLPRSPIDHVHRIGRTGRAGQVGQALSFVSASTEHHFHVIEKSQGRKVVLEQIPGFLPIEKVAFVQPTDGNGGVKGRRKSKKDKLREAAAKAATHAPPDSSISPEHREQQNKETENEVK